MPPASTLPERAAAAERVGRSDARRADRAAVLLTDAALLGMALLWGVNYVVVKFATGVVPPLAFNALRVLLASAVLLALSAAGDGRWPGRRTIPALFGLGLLGNGVYQVLFIEGVARTRAGDAALMLATGPAFVALIGWLRGVERATRRRVVGIALSVAGIALVVLGSAQRTGESTVLGNLLLLAGCLCWSTFTVMLQPYTHDVAGIRVSAITMLGGALLLLAVGAPALAATPWRALPPSAWGALVFSSFGALVLAYLAWYRGVRVLGPTRTAMYGNLQPVIALGVAWLTLGEVPTSWQLVGTAAIMTGLVLTRA
jgi:drug/metabolite transporter (DMT)-like permease